MSATEICAWRCDSCRRVYTDQGIAKQCCEPRTCECGQPIDFKHFAKCRTCRTLNAFTRYMMMEAIPWDGVSLLGVHNDDRYFQIADEACEWVAEQEGISDDGQVTQEMIERQMIVICERAVPRVFDLCEYFSDSISDDGDPPDGWKEIEEAVNKWAGSADWNCWYPSNKRLLLDSP